MANILIITGNLKDWTKNSGGKERTATLAEALINHKVTVLSFTIDNQPSEKRINDYIYEIKPQIENNVLKEFKKLINGSAKVNHDAAIYMLKKHFKIFKLKAKELSKNADLIILDHPSVSPLIEDIDDVPIIYNSHNCEITMAKQLYPDNKEILDIVEKMEKIALTKSIGTTYCSKKDFEEMQKYYKYTGKNIYIPNGTQMQNLSDYSLRIQSKNILFVGSGHPPNIVAAKNLIKIAKDLPGYNFIICGGAGYGIKNETIPHNIKILGQVSDKELHKLFSTCFAFINPMESGSGTHLKMMKALSYGIPIITSLIGARGFTNQEIQDSMLICEKSDEFIEAIKHLQKEKIYKQLSTNGHAISKNYDWEKIKKDYALWIDSFISDKPIVKPVLKEKPKVLIYSIIRNRSNFMNKYYGQIKNIVKTCQDYEFYLSIYENDSDDTTKTELFNKDWSFLKGVSIISENINTKYFESVKSGERVENLAKARNKAIEAGDFLNKVDYILMIEGDVKYDTQSVKNLLEFKNKEPNFDIVSSVSIRKNGTHYDWWATRTSAHYNPNQSELDPDWKQKQYGKYYSTSNGLCLYRAKPFQEGVRHHWINTITKEADCEMVVVCQKFHEKKYNNIYILYTSQSFHI